MDERLALVCAYTGAIIAHVTQSELDEINELSTGRHSYLLDSGERIYFWKRDDEIVDVDYGDSYFETCSECGALINTDSECYTTDVDGDVFCENCEDEVFECECCGRVFRNTHACTVYTTNGERTWCEDCRDDNAFYCEECEEYCHREMMVETHDGTYICDDCYDASYIRCHECDEVYRYDETVELEDGEHYCRDCADDLNNSSAETITCGHCGRPIHSCFAAMVIGDDGNGNRRIIQVCPDCYRSQTWTCRGCSGTFHSSIPYATLPNGDRVCPSCQVHRVVACADCGRPMLRQVSYSHNGSYYCGLCERRHRPPNVITGYHQYSGSGRPVWVHRSMLTPDLFKDLFMGIELELDNGGTDHAKALQITTALGYPANESNEFKCTTDGSLNSGFEIISMPATMDYHLKEYKWEDGMRKASQLGYRSHDAGTCGLHIHVNRSYFQQAMENPEASTIILMCNNRDWLEKFSRRSSWSYCHYKGDHRTFSVDDFKLKDVSRACEVANWLHNTINECKGHHSMVNFANNATIEFRLFRGTLKYNTFVAALQLTQMMCYAIKHLRKEQLVNVDLRWFKVVAKRRGYNEFLNYLVERGIMI